MDDKRKILAPIPAAALIGAAFLLASAEPSAATPPGGSAAISGEQAESFAVARGRLERSTSPMLRRFHSRNEVRRWLRAADAADRALPQEDDRIFIIESRRWPRGSAAPAISSPGVDEGDLVGIAGRYLLVLHDGRLFSIDLAGGQGHDLVVADRVAAGGPGYPLSDELLIAGDRVIVTGYSNLASSVLVSTFMLAEGGRLAREGIWLISSRDDYETAIAGNALIVYTSTDFPYWGGSTPDFTWPTVRSWDQAIADRPTPRSSDEDGEPGFGEDWARRVRAAGPARPLLTAREIFRPAAATLNGELHIVSICPLPAGRALAGLQCRSTGFAAPIHSAFGLSDSAAYLITSQTAQDARWLGSFCPPREDGAQPTRFSLVYRIPFAGGWPGVGAVAGVPLGLPDRPFAVREERVHVLVEDAAPGCGEPGIAYFNLPAANLRGAAAPADAGEGKALPDLFADLVVYGEQHLATFHRNGDELTLLPLDAADESLTLSIPHGVERADPVAGGLLLTGSADRRLRVSFVRLEDGPGLPTAVPIPETAFEDSSRYRPGAAARADGSIIIAVPVDRHPPVDSWPNLMSDIGTRLPAPDIHFFRVEPDHPVRPLGALRRQVEDEPNSPGRACHAPCLPWFDQSRAIFTDGRIFALAGIELIEGRIEAGRIVEVQRLNMLTGTSTASAAAAPVVGR